MKEKIWFTYVAMDGFMEDIPGFLLVLKRCLIYVADISSKDRVILDKPEYGIQVKRAFVVGNYMDKIT